MGIPAHPGSPYPHTPAPHGSSHAAIRHVAFCNAMQSTRCALYRSAGRAERIGGESALGGALRTSGEGLTFCDADDVRTSTSAVGLCGSPTVATQRSLVCGANALVTLQRSTRLPRLLARQRMTAEPNGGRHRPMLMGGCLFSLFPWRGPKSGDADSCRSGRALVVAHGSVIRWKAAPREKCIAAPVSEYP